MNVGVTSAALASVVAFTVSVAVLFRRPRRALYFYFSSFTGALFLWHVAALATRLGGAMPALQHVAAVLLPPTALFFFRELLRSTSTAWRTLAVGSIPASVIFLSLLFTRWGAGWWVRAPALIYVASTLLFVAQAMWRHIQGVKTEADRKRLSFLFYGGATALVLAAGELMPDAGLLAALAHIAVTFYVYFLYQSILSRRFIDLVELLGKAAVLGVLTLVLAAIYSLLVLWVGENQQGLWLFNTLVASFVILILYDQIRPWIEETTAKLVFRQRYDLRRSVEELLRTLRSTISIEEMGRRTLDALVSSNQARNVAMYLRDEDGEPVFRLLGFRGAPPPETLNATEHPTLLQELRRQLKPILLEHLEARVHELPTLADHDATSQRELERVHEAMADMRSVHASLMLPMVVDNQVVGVITLGEETSTPPYSTREIASLLSVAEVCAVIITNSQEFDQARQRDRLAAIGEMATGMAHEIRNPLGAIKGAAQCLDPGDLPASSRELLDVIVEEVDRLNSVVVQFLEYARPYRGNPEPTNINDVIGATTRLLERDAAAAGVEIRADLAHNLPPVNIDPEQLKQVLLNLMQNAIQAMPTAHPHGGRVTVHTSTTHEHAGDLSAEPERSRLLTHVLVRLTDNGPGIKPEDLSRIFVPFFTTKDHGTGLGLPITQRIVENAGGRLEVTSRWKEGTTFTLRLPAHGSEALLTSRPPEGDRPARPDMPDMPDLPDLPEPEIVH